MTGARVRLIVAAALFVGWLGYLAYLALGQKPPVVVSRSQMLMASHIVKADLTFDEAGKPQPNVRVLESLGTQLVPAEPLLVDNLPEALLPGNKPPRSAGTYLLLLESPIPGRFRVASASNGQNTDPTSRPAVIYPWSAEVERQARQP